MEIPEDLSRIQLQQNVRRSKNNMPKKAVSMG
jgi:hypothetical protein